MLQNFGLTFFDRFKTGTYFVSSVVHYQVLQYVRKAKHHSSRVQCALDHSKKTRLISLPHRTNASSQLEKGPRHLPVKSFFVRSSLIQYFIMLRIQTNYYGVSQQVPLRFLLILLLDHSVRPPSQIFKFQMFNRYLLRTGCPNKFGIRSVTFFYRYVFLVSKIAFESFFDNC